MGWDNNFDSSTAIILYVCNGTEKIPPLELAVLIIPAPSIRSRIPDDAIMKSKNTFGTGKRKIVARPGKIASCGVRRVIIK